MDTQPFGWCAFETIGIGIVNYDQALCDPAEWAAARQRVREGKSRWCMRGGGVLCEVAVGAELGEFAYLLDEVRPNVFAKPCATPE